MARGWESKAVEAQQDARQQDGRQRAAQAPRGHTGPPVAPDDLHRRARLATLTLARTRAEADLRIATVSAHRSMLERAIADLNRQIKDLT